jgi:hypothetical protein
MTTRRQSTKRGCVCVLLLLEELLLCFASPFLLLLSLLFAVSVVVDDGTPLKKRPCPISISARMMVNSEGEVRSFQFEF